MSIFALRSNGLASSAYKNLSSTQSSLNANIGRLSSGLRINSTADDSAGSNVTVRMGNQVRGMSQANRNAQDANNLLATAESGLSDISDILSKMRELSVQAATDTLNDNDRSSIELEFQSLKDEITRIANVTEYNGMNVLNGSYQRSNHGDYNQTWSGNGPESLFSNQNNTAYYDQRQPGTSGSSDPHGTEGPQRFNQDGPHDDNRGHWRLQIGADNDINNQHEFSVMNATARGLDLNVVDVADTFTEFKEAIRDGHMGWKVNATTGEMGGEGAGFVEVEWDDTLNSGAGGIRAGVDGPEITNIGLTVEGAEGRDLVANIGTGTIEYSIDDGIGLNFRYDVYDVNVGTVDDARSAVTHLDHAIDEINRERSYIGSEQNKLQFTMSNLTSNIQSIESSRSSIEDVDFAAEAADLAKNQILAQSGTAMLAQASAISQNILGLLA